MANTIKVEDGGLAHTAGNFSNLNKVNENINNNGKEPEFVLADEDKPRVVTDARTAARDVLQRAGARGPKFQQLDNWDDGLVRQISIP